MNVEEEPCTYGWGEGDWMKAWDDVKDRELDPRMVMQARAEEVMYSRKMHLYTKVPKSRCQKVTDKAPKRTNWFDTNKR